MSWQHIRAGFLLFCLFFQSAISARAYNGGYSNGYEPFPDARKVKLILAKKEEIHKDISEIWKFPLPKKCAAKMSIVLGDEAFLVFEHATGSETYSLKNVQPYADEGWATDLNGDGNPDLVLVFSGTGCGLASEHTNTIFALSKKDGYVLRGLKSMGFGAEDIVDVDRDETPEIIHTEFISGGPGKDGKAHSYWVYTFFNIRGTEFKKSSSLSEKWIQYKFKKNHRSTDQLSAEQKIGLWKDQNGVRKWANDANAQLKKASPSFLVTAT